MKRSARIGIYNLRIGGGGGGEKRTLAMAEHLSLHHHVILIVGEECQPSTLREYFRVDIDRIEVARLNPSLPKFLVRMVKGSMLVQNAIRLTENRHAGQIQSLNLDLLINNTWASNLPCPAPRGIYMCMFPHELRGAVPQAGGQRSRLRNQLFGMPLAAIDSYDVTTANSQFTKNWIRRLWGRDSEIVYSVGEPMGPSLQKEHLILNVGRFVDESRADCKHQRLLIGVFQKMRDLHEQGWQLHLAGTVLPDRKSRMHASELVEMARGCPVFFHFNIPFAVLRDLYRRASIYWHATGYGWPADLYPERQEHFGITTVEAMSAGAVPVVVNSGGQRESVTHGESGFLWDDLDGLKDYTRRLTADNSLRQRMSDQAVSNSKQFSRSEFVGRVEGIVDRVLAITDR